MAIDHEIPTLGYGTKQLIITMGYGGINQLVESTCSPVTWTEGTCSPVVWTEKGPCTFADWEEAITYQRVESFLESFMRERVLPGVPAEVMLFPETFIEAMRREGLRVPPEVTPLAGAFIDGTRRGGRQEKFLAGLEAMRREMVLPLVPGVQSVTLRDADCDDCYIRDGTFQNTNTGTQSNIQVRTGTTDLNRRGLVKFLNHGIPTTATIVSATLKLFLSDTYTGAGDTIEVARLLRNFVELEATWNIWATGQSWGLPGASFNGVDYSSINQTSFLVGLGDLIGTEYAIDVAAIVQDQVSGGDPVLAYRLNQNPAGSFVSLGATDHTTSIWRPELTVLYQV